MFEQIDTNQKPRQDEPSQIKSFVVLHQRLSTALRTSDTSAVNNILLQDICKRLSLGIDNFVRVQNVDGLKASAADLKEKLAGKLEIPQLMREQLIVPFAETHSLECKMALRVIDEYFSRNSSKLTYFNDLDKRITEISKNAQQNMYSSQQRYDQFVEEIHKLSTQIRIDARSIYLEERLKLLQCVGLFISAAFREGPFHSRFDDFVFNNFMKESRLAKSLLRGLLRNLEWEKEFRNEEQNMLRVEQHRDPVQTRETLVQSLQSEQIEMLKILIVLYFHSQALKSEEVGLLLQYLKGSMYRGSMGRNYRTVTESPEFTEKMQFIAGLGEMVSLSMVKQRGEKPVPIVTDADKDIWAQITDVKELSQANSPFYFALVQTACLANPKLKETKETQDFFRAIIQGSMIHQIDQLLRSPVLNHDRFKANQGIYYNVIKSWLNLVFPFFQEYKLQEGMYVTQIFSEQVLRNEENVKAVWTAYDKSPDSLFKSLQMFEPILKNPVAHIHRYLKICEALCGKQSSQFAVKVLGIMKQKYGEHTFLTFLFTWIWQHLSKLQQQLCSEEEVSSLSSVFVILSKVIRQSPNLFTEVNDSYMTVIEGRHDIRFSFDASASGRKLLDHDFSHQLYFDVGSQPLIALLTSTLFSFFSVNYSWSKRAIMSILNALSTIYNEYPQLRPEVIERLSSSYSRDNESVVISFFKRCYTDNEYSQKVYKTSECFLRLLCKIFKHEFPQECLSPVARINLSTSFLTQALENVYLPIFQSIRSLPYSNHASFASLNQRLLKLARLMLTHLLDVPQLQKARLHQMSPKFDTLLQIIVISMNHMQVEHECLNALELQEVKFGSNKTRFENKWLWEAVEKGQQSEQVVRKVNKMVTEAFAFFNLLVKLALVDNDTSLAPEAKQLEDDLSIRAFYIQQLYCVRVIKSQILDPNKAHSLLVTQQNGTSVTTSLFGLFTHYMKASEYNPSPIIEAHAFIFLTLACQLWAQCLPESRIPNLALILKQDTLLTHLQLQEVFAAQLIETFHDEAKTGVFTLTTKLLNLLCVLADTQPKFAELVLCHDSPNRLKQGITDAFVYLVRNMHNVQQPTDETVQQLKEISVKLILLFSLLAQRKVCHELIASRDYQLLSLLQDFTNQCFGFINKAQQGVIFTGEFIPPCLDGQAELMLERERKGLLVFNSCLAKVGLVYYTRLLTALYQKDPSQREVRQQIVKLFASNQWKDLPVSTQAVKQQFTNATRVAQSLNEVLQTQNEDRNTDLQQQQYNQIYSNFVAQAQKNESSTLRMEVGGLFVNGVSGFLLHECLNKTPLYRLITNISSNEPLDAWRTQGNLGGELFVSIKEVKYAMRKEFFINEYLTAQAESIFTELNFVLSCLHADVQMVRAKQEFIIQIGKITHRESCLKEIGDALLQTSLLPLISTEPVNLHNEEAFTKSATQIVSIMTSIALSLFNQCVNLNAKGETNMTVQNFYVLKLQGIQIDLLATALSVIACWLRQSPSFAKPILSKIQGKHQSELEDLIKSKLLPGICDLFDFEGTDATVAIESVSGLNAKGKAALKNNETTVYQLFTQLVLQTLQIYQVFYEQQPKAEKTMQKKIDVKIIGILSKTIDCMHREHQFERCLQIFQTVFNLLDEETVLTMMKRGDHSILRAVFHNLGQKNVLKHNETSVIYQLLTSYASTEEGAVHLKEVRILDQLSKSECLFKLYDQELYVTSQTVDLGQQVQVRNPLHIQWCHVLVLIKTLNSQLLEDISTEHMDYFVHLIKLMQFFRDRFAKVLHAGVHLAKKNDAVSNPGSLNIMGLNGEQSQTIITLGLLEETELIMDVLCQMFEHGTVWQEKDPVTFANMKDYAMISVPKLLTFCEARSLQPMSETEKNLQQLSVQAIDRELQAGIRIGDRLVSDQDFTGFSLKAEMHLIKIFMSSSYALLNCLLLSKQTFGTKSDLIQTWFNPQTNQQMPSLVLSQQLFQYDQGTDVLRFAFDTLFLCQERMLNRMVTLKLSRNASEIVLAQMFKMMHEGQRIVYEYSGGLCHHLSVSTPKLDEPMAWLETGLQINSQAMSMVLEKIKDDLISSTGGHAYAYGSYDRFDERSDFVQKAKNLQMLLDQTEKEIASVHAKEASSVDPEFFSKLQTAVGAIEQGVVRY